MNNNNNMVGKNNPTFGKKNKAARAIQALARGVASRKKTSTMRAAKAGVASVPNFGAVSAISTAPVAIGNSMRGYKSQTLSIPGGVRIIGRDYAFTPVATGSVTGWALTGGMPLSPTCMPTTILRNFVQMYAKYKVNSMTFHYITSSSTATTGDVTFYSQKATISSCVNWTAASFLPFVLSDPENVIGPQWTNHSVTVRPTGGWKLCDAYMNSNQTDNAAGDIFLFSKTSSTESPGYVIVDYDIQFKELEYNPRAAYLPLGLAQWNAVSVGVSGALSAGDNITATLGTGFIGSTTITALTTSVGDVFKFIVDSTNSTYSAATAANFFESFLLSNATTELLRDGSTLYVTKVNSTGYAFFTTLEAAVTVGSGENLKAGASVTYAETLRGYFKLVASIRLNTLQYNV